MSSVYFTQSTQQFGKCASPTNAAVTGNITVMASVKFPQTFSSIPNSTLYCILAKYNSNGSKTGYILEVGKGSAGNEFVKFEGRGAGDTASTSCSVTNYSVSMFDHNWHRIGFTRNDSTVILYIDGIEVHRITNFSTASINPTDTSVNLGRVQYGDTGGLTAGWTQGYIDEVSIWNVALSQAEVDYYSKRDMSGSESGLVAYWQFNENTGNTIYDQTGNGNNITLNVSNVWNSSDALDYTNTAPTATGVYINGINKAVGTLLTGIYTFNDIDGDSEGISTYKWYRGNGVSGPWTVIPAQTGLQYRITSADVDKYIMFEVTPKSI